MDSENLVHMQNGILLIHKKNEVLMFLITWMELQLIMLRPRTERQVPYDLTPVWNLKKTDLIKVENRMVVARGWRELGWGWGGRNRKRLIHGS
jgi:hypothetical protein